MALDRMPPEILHITLSYLSIECRNLDTLEASNEHFRYSPQKPDQQSLSSLNLQHLYSLCLVSKRLYNAIQPLLYREFTLGYGDSWKSEPYTWDGRLLSFLRTVARRRDLAGFVKRVHILPQLLQASQAALDKEERDRQEKLEELERRTCPPGWKLARPPEVDISGLFHPDDLPKPQLKPCITEDEARETLREVRAALKINPSKKLAAKDLVTLLVAALSNLQQCSLVFGPESDMSAVHPATLAAAGITKLPLRALNISVLRSKDKPLDFDSYIRPLLTVSPSLEILNLHRCYAATPEGKPRTRQQAFPSIPNLQHIRITSSRLNEKSLENILSSCTGLRSFTYEAAYRHVDRPPTIVGEFMSFVDDGSRWDCSDHFQLRNAVGYLERHCETLESVHIDLRRRGGEPAVLGTFSFREFVVLKNLVLNLDEFHSRFFKHNPGLEHQLLTRILPPNIISFCLIGRIGKDVPRLEKGLIGLADAVGKGQFPALKVVKWDSKDRLDANTVDAVLRPMFVKAAVEFVYVPWLRDTGGDLPPNFENPAYALPDSDDFDDL
ncbi:hypothetical protein BDV18DRAFT_155414 [Aspergillus unguis]